PAFTRRAIGFRAGGRSVRRYHTSVGFGSGRTPDGNLIPTTPAARGRRAPRSGPSCLLAPGVQPWRLPVLREGLLPIDPDAAFRAVPVLLDNKLHRRLLFARVVFCAVRRRRFPEQQDLVGILFDTAGVAEIGHRRGPRFPVLD